MMWDAPVGPGAQEGSLVKASRRAIFRSVFARAGFELQHETANEILMLVNQSLDPIPLTEGMWASLEALRRELRYTEYDRTRSFPDDQAGASPSDPTDTLDVGRLAPHVAKDLVFLLRLESLVRTCTEATGTPDDEEARAARWPQVSRGIARDICQYLGQPDDPISETLRLHSIDPVLRCLARAAGIRGSAA
jgi:hypothetical protein